MEGCSGGKSGGGEEKDCQSEAAEVYEEQKHMCTERKKLDGNSLTARCGKQGVESEVNRQLERALPSGVEQPHNSALLDGRSLSQWQRRRCVYFCSAEAQLVDDGLDKKSV